MKRYSLKHSLWLIEIDMGLLPDTHNCELRMHRVCRKRFSHHRLQRKPIVSYPGMHHGTCVTHVPCCMSGSLTRGGGENVPGACATHNFAYPVRGPTGHNSHRKVGVGGGGWGVRLGGWGVGGVGVSIQIIQRQQPSYSECPPGIYFTFPNITSEINMATFAKI